MTCKTSPGYYSKLVTIQKPGTTGRDAAGHIDLSVAANWDDVTKAYCRVMPQNGREFYRAQQTEANITHLIEMPYSNKTAAIDPSYRLKMSSRYLNVISAINVDEMNRVIRASCIEAV